MTSENSEKDHLEFDKNPYTPDKGPEDIVRLFYSNNVPILPVVSKRGLLIGILTKENVISELSDLERVGKHKIDAFIMKICKKMPLDDLLPVVGNVKEFVIINLFGEIFGKWSRLDLFASCESGTGSGNAANAVNAANEASKQREEQKIEWMIYLVLEHIPRALYALNENGRTIFYNSHFEDIFLANSDKDDVDPKFVEDSLANPDRNDFYYRSKDRKDIYFFNKDLNFFYEKVTMMSEEKKVGSLIFVDASLNEKKGAILPGVDMEAMSLSEMVESVERSILVDSIRQNKNHLTEVAKKLKISRKSLDNKIEKYGINLSK